MTPNTAARRAFAFFILSIVGALLGTAANARPPNIVFILADDLGYGDLGSYGHPYARTPSLDRLAREGTRFTQFYVTGVTCSPSRTGFMTGRYPARFEYYPARQGFADSVTITELLARRGYRTGHFGKWHIGPVARNGTYGIFDIGVGGGSKKDPAGRDAAVFAAATEFVEENRDVPFYVNIWSHIAHAPVVPPAALHENFPEFDFDRSDFGFWAQGNFDKSQFLIDKYNLADDLETAMRKYLSEIWALDAQVGLLIDRLKELGLRNRTLVIFASDQGPAPVFTGNRGYTAEIRRPDERKNQLGYAGGLRGGKHTPHEGGVRSPLIIRWPRRVPANFVNRSSIISATDLLPTLCAIAGIELGPAAEELDGEDISDIWFGATRSRREPIFWKTSSVKNPPTMRLGDWKIRGYGGGSELYNISRDPFERDDLGDRRQDVLDLLEPELARWEATLPKSYLKRRAKSPLRPKADAGPDRIIVDANRDGQVWVKLDASRSVDPDGNISGFVWKQNGRMIAVSQSPFVKLDLGEHTLSLEVTDFANNTARVEFQISVVP